MTQHYPVLAKEVLDFFDPHPLDHFIDGTIGNAGHTSLFLNKKASVTGLDRNANSINIAKINLEKYQDYNIHQDNFSNFDKYLEVDTKGIFIDLGLSTAQIKDDNLGLSFQDDNLDMRLDKTTSPTGEEIINKYSEDELVYIFSKYAQEINSKKIAQIILKNRPIKSAKNLSLIIENELGRHGKTHPATKVFMALRIIVNNEYENLNIFLEKTKTLAPRTKIGIITFHSGEDRIVKNFTTKNSTFFKTNKLISPSYQEIKLNPPSRSAAFRTFIKI